MERPVTDPEPKNDQIELGRPPAILNPDEGQLLWDEFKYRHDLIWRHLIRSTLALVVLATIGYSTPLRIGKPLLLLASAAAILYWIVTFITIEAELRLFQEIARLHTARQRRCLGAKWPWEVEPERPPAVVEPGGRWGRPFVADSFGRRVAAYLVLLFLTTIIAAGIVIFESYRSAGR
jgi:hypothetical protein